ncbi:YfcE family phosphodiesterase, partial [Priestia megaterium]
MKQKIAIISDIHGNSLALEAVLSDISRREIDTVFN